MNIDNWNERVMHECNVGERYVLLQAWALGLSWSMSMARNNPLLGTVKGPEGSTGWRAPVAPIDKDAPDMAQVLVLAQVLGVVSGPSMHICSRA